MDLWIELTKLYALHEACQQLEHGVKGARQDTGWRTFSPTRFIYAYFTFNSIYNYSWNISIEQRKAVRWQPDENGRLLREPEQFKLYIRFCSDNIGSETPGVYTNLLGNCLRMFSIQDPEEALKGIRPSNETTKVKRYREAFPSNFSKLRNGQISQNDHYATLITTLMFVYAVRNNIFHGSKTRIEMEDEAQQQRLLIYSALLIAANGMLFEALKCLNVPWNRPPVNFALKRSFGFDRNSN